MSAHKAVLVEQRTALSLAAPASYWDITSRTGGSSRSSAAEAAKIGSPSCGHDARGGDADARR